MSGHIVIDPFTLRKRKTDTSMGYRLSDGRIHDRDRCGLLVIQDRMEQVIRIYEAGRVPASGASGIKIDKSFCDIKYT